jgi:hypothetical protein
MLHTHDYIKVKHLPAQHWNQHPAIVSSPPSVRLLHITFKLDIVHFGLRDP